MKKEKDSFIRVSAATRSLVEGVQQYLITVRGEARDAIKAEYGDEIEIDRKVTLSDSIKLACKQYLESTKG